MPGFAFRQIAATALILASAATAASARDKWTGPYLGLIAGVANGHSTATSTIGCPATGFLCDPTHYPEYGALIGATASGSKSGAAFTGGVVAGFNWQTGRVVYGVESDVSALQLRLTRGGSGASLNLGLTNPGPVPVMFASSATAEANWLATFRVRAGYLVSPDLLLFATGGLALTDLTVSNLYTDDWVFNGGGFGASRVSSLAAGYVVGGGIEWAAGRGWTLRAEYLRIGFGSLTTSAVIIPLLVPAAQNPFTSSARLSADLFRAGVSLRF